MRQTTDTAPERKNFANHESKKTNDVRFLQPLLKQPHSPAFLLKAPTMPFA